jgi:hypothetical protein
VKAVISEGGTGYQFRYNTAGLLIKTPTIFSTLEVNEPIHRFTFSMGQSTSSTMQECSFLPAASTAARSWY